MGFSRYMNRCESECHGLEFEIKQPWIEDVGQVLVGSKGGQEGLVVDGKYEVGVALHEHPTLVKSPGTGTSLALDGVVPTLC